MSDESHGHGTSPGKKLAIAAGVVLLLWLVGQLKVISGFGIDFQVGAISISVGWRAIQTMVIIVTAIYLIVSK